MSFRSEKLTVALVVITASAISFLYVNYLNAQWVSRGRGMTQLEQPADALIPLIPAFVYGYVLYYAWVLLVIPILINRKQLYHVAGAFALLQLASVITFLAYPSHFPHAPLPWPRIRRVSA